jgi:hypothetical protein
VSVNRLDSPILSNSLDYETIDSLAFQIFTSTFRVFMQCVHFVNKIECVFVKSTVSDICTSLKFLHPHAGRFKCQGVSTFCLQSYKLNALGLAATVNKWPHKTRLSWPQHVVLSRFRSLHLIGAEGNFDREYKYHQRMSETLGFFSTTEHVLLPLEGLIEFCRRKSVRS